MVTESVGEKVGLFGIAVGKNEGKSVGALEMEGTVLGLVDGRLEWSDVGDEDTDGAEDGTDD